MSFISVSYSPGQKHSLGLAANTYGSIDCHSQVRGVTWITSAVAAGEAWQRHRHRHLQPEEEGRRHMGAPALGGEQDTLSLFCDSNLRTAWQSW